MSTGWVEKRQNERVLATLKATFQRLSPLKAQEMMDHPDYMSTPSNPGGGGGMFHAETKDVSAGGMALVAQDPLRPGERILVQIELPQLPKPISCLAEVRWLSSFEEMKRVIYRAGLKFLSIHKDDVARLNEYVQGRPKAG